MSNYLDIYNKRLNKYGNTYQSRMQGKREKDFEAYLARSVYTISFTYGETSELGSFEKYKQDETETLYYLLTRVNVNITNGSILSLPNKDGILCPWMVYYLENMKASGYNRYILLRMTHYLTWTDKSGITRNSWAYMYGQEDNMLKDEIRSRSRMDTIYSENLKSSFFIMPLNQYLLKDTYLEVGVGTDFLEGYRVTGYDRQSSNGIEYVTIDPIYIYDKSPKPVQQEGDNPEDFFWLNGGVLND